MILIDFSQVVISNLMAQIGSNPNLELDENLIRHMVLNSLRSYIKQFKESYGEVIIACDSKHQWRREIFPNYKANRKKSRANSNFDWQSIFSTLKKIREELKVFFPYKVLEVNGAEADDIIATLSFMKSAHEPVLILSSDKDFLQLQKWPNVRQYSPRLKKFLETDNPSQFLKEHIIKGDHSDGIPNFLSPDDTFVSGKRQRAINKNKLDSWLLQLPEDFCTNDTTRAGYARNKTLVDLTNIPTKITLAIIESYENTSTANRQKMLSYFIDKRLSNLIEVIEEF